MRACRSASLPRSNCGRRRPPLHDDEAGALTQRRSHFLAGGQFRGFFNTIAPLLMGWTAPRAASSVPRWSSLKSPSGREAVVGKSIIDTSSVTRVGLDLAKRVFRIHAVDATGSV